MKDQLEDLMEEFNCEKGEQGEEGKGEASNQEDVDMGALVRERIAFIEAEEKRVKIGRRTTARRKWSYIGEEFGLQPGEAMDISEGWDFTKPRHREAAGRYLEKIKPKVIINRIEEPRRGEHNNFVRELCGMQSRKKSYFVHEQRDKGGDEHKVDKELKRS